MSCENPKAVFITVPGQGGGSIKYAPLNRIAREHGFDVEYTENEKYRGSKFSIKEVASDLIKVIKKVNNAKPNCNLVVFGYSMGGLTAQYAISKLLSDGYDPLIKVFLTLDSPMRGVNVPLAYQYFLKYTPDSYLSKENRKKRDDLFKKASLEMMLNCHYGDVHGLGTPNTYHVAARPHPSHAALMEELAPMKKNTGWSSIYKLGIASGSKDSRYDIDDHFFKFKKKFWYRHGYLDFYRVGNKSQKLLYSKNSEGYPEGNILLKSVPPCWDSAPGSISDVPKKVNQGLIELFKKKVPCFKEKNDIESKVNFCCYIPTISALDINTDDPLYTVNKSFTEIRERSWFDEISISSTNGPHIPKELSDDQRTKILSAFARLT